MLGIVAAGSKRIELHSDEHAAYPRALRRLPGLEVEHHTISSRAARTPRSPLFAINLFDALVGHSCANHKRLRTAMERAREAPARGSWLRASAILGAQPGPLGDAPSGPW